MSAFDPSDPAIWVPVGIAITTGFATMQAAIFRTLKKHDIALALVIQALDYRIRPKSPSQKQSLQDTINDVTED